MAQPLSFRWDEDFVALIDKVRGDIPRSRFVRRAVEQWIRRTYVEEDVEQALGGERERDGVPGPVPTRLETERLASTPERAEHRSSPAPAERPAARRSSAQIKGDIKPIPKGVKS